MAFNGLKTIRIRSRSTRASSVRLLRFGFAVQHGIRGAAVGMFGSALFIVHLHSSSCITLPQVSVRCIAKDNLSFLDCQPPFFGCSDVVHCVVVKHFV
jgi:hypothetical protein